MTCASSYTDTAITTTTTIIAITVIAKKAAGTRSRHVRFICVAYVGSKLCIPPYHRPHRRSDGSRAVRESGKCGDAC